MTGFSKTHNERGLGNNSLGSLFFLVFLPVLFLLLTAISNLCAEEAVPSELANVGIDEKLGTQVPMDAKFKDDRGNEVTLAKYFKTGKPVLLNFAYYRCPMLCNLVLTGILKGIKPLAWLPGNEYEIVTVGIDPREGPEAASAKKATHIAELNRPGAELGWHFLTGKEEEIKRVTNALGFRYAYNPKQDDFAHQAAIFTVSPAGIVSRYLYGIEYSPKDIRLALLDASNGRSLSLGDKLVMFCYRYDPESKSYVLFARNFMRGGGYVVLLALGSMLGILWRKEFKRKIASRVVTAEPGA